MCKMYGGNVIVSNYKKYTNRKASVYNVWRTLFQFIICKIFYKIRLKLIYRLKVEGMENIPKDNDYIVCANHLSTLDPPMLAAIFPRRIAFMAKQELFDIPFICWWIDWLGTFAVNRESLEPSTIKTVMEIKKSKWVLGLFPQGTRQKPGVISNVSKGFAGLARITKCSVLPVGLVGTEKATHIPFSGKVVVKIGKPIPYDKNPDVVVNKWVEQIQELTGFKYEKDLGVVKNGRQSAEL